MIRRFEPRAKVTGITPILDAGGNLQLEARSTLIEFVSVNPKEILRQMLEDYSKASGETLYPGDQRHLFLSQMAAILAAAKGAINDAAMQNLIPGARGDALDAIGGMFDVARLPASPARCALRFSASPTQGEDIPIPAGTRATPDGTDCFCHPAGGGAPPGLLPCGCARCGHRAGFSGQWPAVWTDPPSG